MWIELAIDELVAAEWNYKTNEPALTEKLKSNIKRNGMIQNLIVRRIQPHGFEVVNGNHRLDVLKSLKIKKVMCFDLGEVSDAFAYKLAITTNETKFESDKKKLAEVIRDLNQEFGIDDLVKTLPYSSQDIENMQAALDFQWENEDALKPSSDASDSYEDSGDSRQAPERENAEVVTLDLRKIEMNLTKEVSERFMGLLSKIASESDIDLEPSDLDNSQIIKKLNEKMKGLL
jgi:hypothetical protein